MIWKTIRPKGLFDEKKTLPKLQIHGHEEAGFIVVSRQAQPKKNST